MVSAFEAEQAFADDPVAFALRLDGSQPLTARVIHTVQSVCDTAESGGGILPVHVSGAPLGPVADDVDVALVSKWERTLRRLERLAVTTVALASGDCGGLALDAMLTTDLRIATPNTRLLVSVLTFPHDPPGVQPAARQSSRGRNPPGTVAGRGPSVVGNGRQGPLTVSPRA